MGCPMSFGDLNIPSSRAFWDDCDEDDCPQKPLEKYTTSEEDVRQQSSQCKLMFVIEGSSISEFAEASLLKNAKKIADIPKKCSLYYVADKEMLLVIINEDLTSSGEICALLLELCQAEKVITLTIKPKVDYKSENIASLRDEITFLRAIDGNVNNIEALETPNFIAGVAAGICSWRSNKRLQVQSYVAYTDNITLDSVAAKPIVKLLRELDIECADTYNPKNRDDSHLYT